jgi:hypothetical protein
MLTVGKKKAISIARKKAASAKKGKPSILGQIEKTADKAYQVISTADTAAQYAQKAVKLAPLATKITGGARVIGVIPGLFAVSNFFQSLYKLMKERPGIQKARRYFSPLRHANTAASSACDMAQFLFLVGGVPEKAIAWVPKTAPYLLPIGAISAGLGAFDAWKCKKFADKLDIAMAPIREKKGIRGKASAVVAALDFVRKAEKKSLRDHCAIAKSDPLRKVCGKLMLEIRFTNGANKKKAIEQGETLLENLKDRVRKNFRLSVFSTVLSIVGVVLGILFLATPVGQVLLGLAAVAALLGLLHFWMTRRLRKTPIPLLAAPV